MKYLEMGQALRAHGTFRLAGGIHQYDEAQYEVRHFFLYRIYSYLKFIGIL